jgi:hypothetical protein
MWSDEQRYRLACEENLLESKLPQFQFHDRRGNTYISGWESSPNHRYCLMVPIPWNFPHEQLRLFVIHPIPLWKFGGREELSGTSHDFHTLGCNEKGFLEICHCPPGTWDSSKTFFSVLFKGTIWISLYEEHLRTGQTIEQGYLDYERRIRQ